MPLINIALYSSWAEGRVPVVSEVVQTDFCVKPTNRLLWVALDWVADALLGFGVMTISKELFHKNIL